ncbi:MAG: ankyrin repeat domain-containing protein [Thermoplasmata archaeon]|nr:ankyrin repeat domain-containing protein [Thermoplasmata archaeon]
MTQSEANSVEVWFSMIAQGQTDRVVAVAQATPKLLRSKNEAGETPVLAATYRGRTELAQRLVAIGAPVGPFEAAALGDVARLRELLDHDPALVHAYSDDGWTLLHLAAFFGHPEAVELLLHRGASLGAKARNDTANEPLEAASANGRIEVVKLLLLGGATVDATTGRGITALHAAAQNGDPDLVELLLEHGADPSLPTGDGPTAAEIAGRAGHVELARRLERRARIRD